MRDSGTEQSCTEVRCGILYYGAPFGRPDALFGVTECVPPYPDMDLP